MKNKLLLTSALAGSLMFTGFASAQTTISGNLDISYKVVSSDGLATQTSSNDRFGKESQINLANKGKLSNGLDYAAGFSLEFDGNDANDVTANAQNLHNENVYIDFISGNTTFTVGVDHIQNSDRTLGTLLGEDAEDLADGIRGVNTGISISSVGADPAATYGAGIMQKTPVGTLSAWYSPRAGGANQGVSTNDVASAVDNDNGKSGYEFGFAGDLGIKGLSSHLFYNKAEAAAGAIGATQDRKGTNIGLSYNAGVITAGVNRKDVDESAANTETKQMEYSIAYAATKEISIGLNVSKADRNIGAASATDEKVKSIAVGYNMGPVALVAQYGQVEGHGGLTANTSEGDVGYIQLSTRF